MHWLSAPSFGDGATVPERFGVGFSPGPGKTCCRNKRQQEEPPVGLEAGSQLKSQGKWLGVGGTFLWDFTYLCWNLTRVDNAKPIEPLVISSTVITDRLSAPAPDYSD